MNKRPVKASISVATVKVNLHNYATTVLPDTQGVADGDLQSIDDQYAEWFVPSSWTPNYLASHPLKSMEEMEEFPSQEVKESAAKLNKSLQHTKTVSSSAKKDSPNLPQQATDEEIPSVPLHALPKKSSHDKVNEWLSRSHSTSSPEANELEPVENLETIDIVEPAPVVAPDKDVTPSLQNRPLEKSNWNKSWKDQEKEKARVWVTSSSQGKKFEPLKTYGNRKKKFFRSKQGGCDAQSNDGSLSPKKGWRQPPKTTAQKRSPPKKVHRSPLKKASRQPKKASGQQKKSTAAKRGGQPKKRSSKGPAKKETDKQPDLSWMEKKMESSMNHSKRLYSRDVTFLGTPKESANALPLPEDSARKQAKPSRALKKVAQPNKSACGSMIDDYDMVENHELFIESAPPPKPQVVSFAETSMSTGTGRDTTYRGQPQYYDEPSPASLKAVSAGSQRSNPTNSKRNIVDQSKKRLSKVPLKLENNQPSQSSITVVNKIVDQEPIDDEPVVVKVSYNPIGSKHTPTLKSSDSQFIQKKIGDMFGNRTMHELSHHKRAASVSPIERCRKDVEPEDDCMLPLHSPDEASIYEEEPASKSQKIPPHKKPRVKPSDQLDKSICSPAGTAGVKAVSITLTPGPDMVTAQLNSLISALENKTSQKKARYESPSQCLATTTPRRSRRIKARTPPSPVQSSSPEESDCDTPMYHNKRSKTLPTPVQHLVQETSGQEMTAWRNSGSSLGGIRHPQHSFGISKKKDCTVSPSEDVPREIQQLESLHEEFETITDQHRAYRVTALNKFGDCVDQIGGEMIECIAKIRCQQKDLKDYFQAKTQEIEDELETLYSRAQKAVTVKNNFHACCSRIETNEKDRVEETLDNIGSTLRILQEKSLSEQLKHSKDEIQKAVVALLGAGEL